MGLWGPREADPYLKQRVKIGQLFFHMEVYHVLAWYAQEFKLKVELYNLMAKYFKNVDFRSLYTHTD